jgi:hypothetical protein
MTITNNSTATALHYFIECPGAADCGDLGYEGEAVLPHYDNKTFVKVTLIISRTTDGMEVVLSDPGL